MYISLSEYAKRKNIGYQTAWRRFYEGKLEGAFRDEFGRIHIPEILAPKKSASIVYVKILRKQAIFKRFSKLASGYDVCACLDEEYIVLQPFEIIKVPTGIALEIPYGLEAQVRSRSSLSLKGLVVCGGIGTIDADYRGEIFVPIINLSNKKRQIADGRRIAQIVFCPIVNPSVIQSDTLTRTERGEGGFGSTGM